MRHTTLHDRHVALGARMVDFAGWEMPVEYAGLMEEHAAVRERAGLFDVSHMGELSFRGPGALATLQRLVPSDVGKLEDGRALYTVLLTERGTIIDDVILYRLAEGEYLMVVNASNRAKAAQWCARHVGPGCVLQDVSDAWALLALQGPRAQEILAKVTDVVLDELLPFSLRRGLVAGAQGIVARTGYTGEDGFEIFVASAAAPPVWDALLAAGRDQGLVPAGLGARDSLRTEMKFSLYGNEIDETTTPLEAGLGWVVKLDKGDFIGREALLRQKAEGVARKLVGFEMIDAGIPRHGYPIVDGERRIGVVTSGTFSPTLRKPIGIGYVPAEKAAMGTELAVDIRGKVRRARVVQTPFYRRGEKKGATTT